MAMSNTVARNMYEYLNHNFLFNNDVNSIHILLNLYDLEKNITNIYPKYFSVKKLRNNIINILKARRGKYLAASNLGYLLHEDINRLELFLYLEGYKQGYANNKLANRLEDLTLRHIPLPDLYSSKYLFHFNNNFSSVDEFKKNLLHMLRKDYKADNKLSRILSNYIGKIIKPKIFSLNKHLDKQLTIDYTSNYTFIREDEAMLTLAELEKIYGGIKNLIFKSGFKVYSTAYWYGLNDRVLKRYR